MTLKQKQNIQRIKMKKQKAANRHRRHQCNNSNSGGGGGDGDSGSSKLLCKICTKRYWIQYALSPSYVCGNEIFVENFTTLLTTFFALVCVQKWLSAAIML